MADLRPMPPMTLDPGELTQFGAHWLPAQKFPGKKHGGYASAEALGAMLDQEVAQALAEMLGGIPIVKGNRKKGQELYPDLPDCVETSPVTVVGGIRKQTYDVAYRPDGVRFAFDSKTLSSEASKGKNWQNMVNDLATEAATVHTRFPLAVVAFVVLIPEPALPTNADALIWRLDGLGGRADEFGPAHVAEAMSLGVWDPHTGHLSSTIPDPSSHPNLRIETFSTQIEEAYKGRYAGMLPH